MDKFDASKLPGCEGRYDDTVARLNRGDRFVVLLPRLACDDTSHQVRVYMTDLFEARISLGGSSQMPIFFLMDCSGIEFSITRDGADFIDFSAWLAGSFCRQFAGIIELPQGRDPDEASVSEMLASTDMPDLMFWNVPGKYASLLVFDPYDMAYRVLGTWIKDFCNFVPTDLQSAIDCIEEVALLTEVDAMRKTPPCERAPYFEKIMKILDNF